MDGLRQNISTKRIFLESKQFEYHLNGVKASQGVYKASKREGNWKWWHSNKQLKMEASFKANRYFGDVNVYDSLGVFIGGLALLKELVNGNHGIQMAIKRVGPI